MSDARYYRAKAEFCFGIAQVLSDPVAAGQTRALASECVRRAQELETVTTTNPARRLAINPSNRTMSAALAPKADICDATRDVRYGP